MNTSKIKQKRSTLSKKFTLAIWFVVLLVMLGCNTEGFLGQATVTSVNPSSPLVEVSAIPSMVSSQGAAEPAATVEEAAGTEEVTTQPLSGTPKPVYWFSEEDCACMTYPGEVYAKYGPGSLQCRYNWSGRYIEGNQANINIKHYDDPALLEEVYAQESGWLRDTARTYKTTTQLSTDPVYTFEDRDGPDGFGFMATHPGGESYNGEEIPLCFIGSTVLVVEGGFLVKLQLDSCDLGEERENYLDAMQALETCALSSITKAKAGIP